VLKILSKLVICSVFLLKACVLEDKDSESDWEGNDISFSEEFSTLHTLDSGPILFKRKSEKPFFGRIKKDLKDSHKLQTFSGGKLHGMSITQKNDGSRVEASFKHGILHGEMKFYDSSNHLRASIHYIDGKLQPSRIKK
jgi:antitoxin component YwqK of YwqJK toxin-antitoxin module